MLGGGLTRGTSTLLLGPSGVGKTTTAVHCMHAALKRGERATYYLFDEGMSTLLMRSRLLGMDIEPFVESGACRVIQIDPAELAPYVAVADQLARHEIANLDDRKDRIGLLEEMIVGQVVFATVLTTLRRLAEEHHSHERFGEVPAAFVVMRTGMTEEEARDLLDAHCIARLERWKRPRLYALLPEIPRTMKRTKMAPPLQELVAGITVRDADGTVTLDALRRM